MRPAELSIRRGEHGAVAEVHSEFADTAALGVAFQPSALDDVEALREQQVPIRDAAVAFRVLANAIFNTLFRRAGGEAFAEGTGTRLCARGRSRFGRLVARLALAEGSDAEHPATPTLVAGRRARWQPGLAAPQLGGAAPQRSPRGKLRPAAMASEVRA